MKTFTPSSTSWSSAASSKAINLGGNAHRKPGDLGTYFQDPTNGMHIQMLNSDSSEFSKQFSS